MTRQMPEDKIIKRYFAPLASEVPGAHNLRDDAAYLPGESQGLVVTMDTLISGIHFRAEDPVDLLGWKALGVNISDLASKGADPSHYFLSLALPRDTEPEWLEAFAKGLGAAQQTYGCHLAGGDTVATKQGLQITITALGVPGKQGMVPRGGAKVGDHIYISGTIGDAALGLPLLAHEELETTWGLTPEEAEHLRTRYWRPEPRLAAIQALRAHATAAMDVSDGLAGDLVKLCCASNVGARIDTQHLPLSEAAKKALEADPGLLESIVTGGDDYEVLSTVAESDCADFEAAALASGMTVASIGRILDDNKDVTVVDVNGEPVHLARPSYDHFS